MKRSTLILLGILTVCSHIGPGVARCAADGVHPSVWVYPSYDGELLYNTDVNGVRINDFSECGYRRGLVELPNVTNVVDQSRWLYLHPLGGGSDDSAGINAALNYVASFGTNAKGFCGVVCLGPGAYQVGNTIRITNSGVVLKGSGISPINGTRLYALSSLPYPLIEVAGTTAAVDVPGPAATFTEPFVPAGTRTFRVDTTNGFRLGDLVLVTHPSTQRWIHDNDMDQLAVPWTAGGFNSDFERVITRIEGNWITVDTPIPQTFEAQYGYGTVLHLSWPDRLRNCGVEDLYCHTDYPHEDEDGGGNPAVLIRRTTDAWVRGLAADGFFSSATWLTESSKFVTIAGCSALASTNASQHFRYGFYLDAMTQYALVRDCYAYRYRHSFVIAGRMPGPNAFVRCDADYSDDETGPHERWSTGTLLDNVRELGGQTISTSGHEITVQNRGNSGGGGSYQGWTAAFDAVWNCYAEDGFRVRNPPTARNWLIGCDGEKKESRHGCWYSVFDFLPFVGDGDCWCVGADPDGTYDQSDSGSPPVQQHSLYYAQLQQRLKYPGSYFREYRLGDIGWNPGSDNNIPVDANWLSQVQALAGPGAVVVNNFDVLAPNQWTAFTFNFPIAPGEQVVAASLSLGLVVPPGDHHLYLYTVDVAQSFTNLGWLPANDGASRYTVEIPPSALQGGQLNVAIDGNCGVDFALLNFQAAPVTPASTETLNPLDAYVRGGDYANQNYATDIELIVKNDSDASFSRRAFLDWDLIEALNFPGPLVDAKVRLYCHYSGQPGNEQSVAKVPDGAWSIPTLTWNNQPATDPPFAYFVPQPGSYTEFTVTPQVAAVLASPNKRFSLCIDSARDWGGHGDVAYASTEDTDPSHWPQLILSFANSPPTIAVPPPQTMSGFFGATLGPLAVTIGDRETPPGSLVLTANSSNPLLIDNSQITLGGSGSNRTVTITLPGFRLGASLITLTVSDGVGTASGSFPVVVNCSSPVSISPIADWVTNEDQPLTVPFTIGTQCGGPETLIVVPQSSNLQLFPPGSLQVVSNSSPFNRALVLIPAPNQNGIATITIGVSDGISATNRTFAVTVRPVNNPPQHVTITSPHGGDNLPPGVPAPLSADAFDVETNLARIEFYAQPNQLLGTVTNTPYSVTWSNPPVGAFTLYAIAYDTTSLSATSPPVNVTVSAPVYAPPRLYVRFLSNSLALAWLDSVSSNALQTTTSLVPPVVWSPVTGPSLAGEGAWFYFVSPTEPRRYYRLAY